MNNENMLKIAIGMGFDAVHVTSTKSQNINCVEYIKHGWVEVFKPTEGELIKWLSTKGNLNISETGIDLYKFKQGQVVNLFYAKHANNLKENLLSIVLQVIESEE